MLIYHPAFDAYHCVFRMLIVANQLVSIEVDKARILDFYLAFPSALVAIRWPGHFRTARRLAASAHNPYRSPVSPRTTLREMRLMQDAALRCLAAAELIEADALQTSTIRRTEREIPAALLEPMRRHVAELGDVAELVFSRLGSIALLGADGLKDRTSLMDYRYDAA